MNRIVVAIACMATSGLGGLALAQQPPVTPPPTDPPSDYPQPMNTPTPSPSAGTTSHADKRALEKQCIVQQEQQQSSTGMSKHEMKKYCKNQVKAETESQPKPQ